MKNILLSVKEHSTMPGMNIGDFYINIERLLSWI